MNALGILSTIFVLIAAAPEKTREIKDPSQMIAEVKGMVCVFCSFAVREKLERLEFLDKKMFRKGKVANVEEGTVTMALARGKPVDFAGLYRIMHKGGYDIQAVHLNLIGTLAGKGDAMVILNEFSGQEFSLVDEYRRPWWGPEDFKGKRISVEGVIPEDVLANPEAWVRMVVRVKSARLAPDRPAEQKQEDKER